MTEQEHLAEARKMISELRDILCHDRVAAPGGTLLRAWEERDTFVYRLVCRCDNHLRVLEQLQKEAQSSIVNRK